MALAISAPAVSLSGIPGGGAIAGLVLPASEANAIAANTQANFPNNGAVLLRIVMSTTAATADFQIQKQVLGYTPPVTTITQALSASTTYIFGPFSPSTFNDANGLCWVTFSVSPTGATLGVYSVPGVQS